MKTKNKELLELYEDVRNNTYIPPRFRKLTKEQWKKERPKYAAYLKRVIEGKE